MPISQGIASQLDYTAVNNDPARVALLLAALPDPDTANLGGSGAIQGILGFFDEMSPIALAQLRVELTAMQAEFAKSAMGSYTVVAADDTANQINITTGIADFTLANTAVSIYRAGTEVLTARTLSKQAGGVLRIADSTYQATAGDVVRWAVQL